MFIYISFLVICCGFLHHIKVAGLECYVCDDCNDLKDFENLQRCEEAPVIDIYGSTTSIPVDFPQTFENATVKLSNTKPPEKEEGSGAIENDDLEYEDYKVIRGRPQYSVQDQDEGVHPSYEKSTTASSQALATNEDHYIQHEAFNKPLGFEKNIWEDYDLEYEENPFVRNRRVHLAKSLETFAPSNAASNKSKLKVDIKRQHGSQIILDYDSQEDYIDNGFINRDPSLTETYTKQLNHLRYAPRESFTSSPAVCYLIKVTINNTLVTKRGCSNLINASNQLTCQSLHNDAPLEVCHICNANACNKFLIADDGENLGNSVNIAANINLSMLFSIFMMFVPLL
uniref:Protein quiver n=1 Tax=Glossina pallidipes TaxID=7398 RepID=A0A1A9ZDB2_GLOPL